jgi:hypothetical protein
MGLSGASRLKVLYAETGPSLETIFRVIPALGLKLCAGVKEDVEVICVLLYAKTCGRCLWKGDTPNKPP